MNTAQKALLEKQYGWDVGRDPRHITREQVMSAGHQPMSPLKALRLRCLDCCAGQPSEVRLCTAVACTSWPFRMRNNPWRKEPSEAQMEARRHAGARLARRAKNSTSLMGSNVEVEHLSPNPPDSPSREEKSIRGKGLDRQQSTAPEVTR